MNQQHYIYSDPTLLPGKPLAGGVRLPTELENVLRDLGQELGRLYGDRYMGVVLYGSYARNEADEGSDVDLLMLLDAEVELGPEIRRTSGLVSRLSLQAGYTLSVIPVSTEHYRSSKEPYLCNARREGLLLKASAVQ